MQWLMVASVDFLLQSQKNDSKFHGIAFVKALKPNSKWFSVFK